MCECHCVLQKSGHTLIWKLMLLTSQHLVYLNKQVEVRFIESINKL